MRNRWTRTVSHRAILIEDWLFVKIRAIRGRSPGRDRGLQRLGGPKQGLPWLIEAFMRLLHRAGLAATIPFDAGQPADGAATRVSDPRGLHLARELAAGSTAELSTGDFARAAGVKKEMVGG